MSKLVAVIISFCKKTVVDSKGGGDGGWTPCFDVQCFKCGNNYVLQPLLSWFETPFKKWMDPSLKTFQQRLLKTKQNVKLRLALYNDAYESLDLRQTQ